MSAGHVEQPATNGLSEGLEKRSVGLAGELSLKYVDTTYV